MPSFGVRSRKNRDTCHPDLIAVLDLAIQITDFSVIGGHRGKAAQDEAFATGNSHVRWPKSKHNSWPSRAVDVAPWPIDWYDKEAFAYLGGVVMACGHMLGIRLRWGHDWDMDGNLHNQSFVDAPHIELIEEGAVSIPRIIA